MLDLNKVLCREFLYVKGLYCPEPVLRTERVMRELEAGESLTVLSTDPAAVIDFTYYCHCAGLLELLSVAKEPYFSPSRSASRRKRAESPNGGQTLFSLTDDCSRRSSVAAGRRGEAGG